MGSQDLEAARRAIEAVNSGDLNAVEALWADHVTIDFSASRSPYAGTYEGRTKARRFVEGIFEAWEELRWEPRDVVDLGDGRILLDNVIKARGRDGLEVEGRGAQLWTLRDGLLTHMRLFQSRDEAEEWLAAQGSAGKRANP